MADELRAAVPTNKAVYIWQTGKRSDIEGMENIFAPRGAA